MQSKHLRPKDLFTPKGSLRGNHAKLFSGRASIVVDAVEAIEVPGASAIIYGDRGVGKSSFAWQLFEILERNKEVYQQYPELGDLDNEYVCLWIECEKRYQNVAGVLLSLLRETVGKRGRTIKDVFPHIFDHGSSDKVQRAYEFNIGIAKAKISVDPSLEKKSDLSKVLDKALQAQAAQIQSEARKRSGNKELIIFIDEFDRLPDKEGMGDFVKHFGDARVVIIGVAETANELLGQHPSSARKFTGSEIEVLPLEPIEVKNIFRKASQIVESDGRYCSLIFSDDFLNLAVEASGGYPAIAQFLGYHAVRNSKALERAVEQDVVVGIEEYHAACKSIFATTGSRGRPELNAALRDGIGKSHRRAAILDSLADFEAGWVKTNKLRDALEKDDQEKFSSNIRKLVEAYVLTSSVNKDKVKFTTPVLRLITRLAREANVLYQ